MFGNSVGFQTRITSLTEDSVVFDTGGNIELPHVGWSEIELDVRDVEPLTSEWVEKYLTKATGEQNQWERIECEKSKLTESIERVRFWRSQSTVSSITVNKIYIPRSRVEEQITVLNEAIEKELTSDEAEK